MKKIKRFFILTFLIFSLSLTISVGPGCGYNYCNKADEAARSEREDKGGEPTDYKHSGDSVNCNVNCICICNGSEC